MNCVVCHQPVEDQGDTLPRSVHLSCVPRWMNHLEQAEHAMFVASIPFGAKTIQFRRYAPLRSATQSEPEALDS